MTHTNYIGIDIGGTKVHIGVVQDGQIINEVRFETSAQAPQEQILGELVRHIQLMLDTADVAGIGIGVPGLVDEQQGVVHNVQNIPSWREVRLKEHLARHFAQQYQQEGGALHALARTGDAHALEALASYGRHLGNVIKMILHTLAPEAIFLGGSVSHCYEFFREAMEASIREFPFRLVTDRLVVAPSELRNAAVLGAAALCKMKQERPMAVLHSLSL